MTYLIEWLPTILTLLAALGLYATRVATKAQIESDFRRVHTHLPRDRNLLAEHNRHSPIGRNNNRVHLHIPVVFPITCQSLTSDSIVRRLASLRRRVGRTDEMMPQRCRP